MQGLNIDTWYKGLLAASVAVIGMAGLAKLFSVVWIAAGVGFWALSAWAGETKQQGLLPASAFFPGGKITRTYFRLTPMALLFAVIGTLLIAWGAVIEVRREFAPRQAGQVVAAGKGDAQKGEGEARKGQ